MQELHPGEEYNDTFAWVGSSDREFFTKSIMTFIKNDYGVNKDSIWQQI